MLTSSHSPKNSFKFPKPRSFSSCLFLLLGMTDMKKKGARGEQRLMECALWILRNSDAIVWEDINPVDLDIFVIFMTGLPLIIFQLSQIPPKQGFQRRKWQPTPVFLPGKSQGRGSLVGCRLWVAQSRTRLKQLSSSKQGFMSIKTLCLQILAILLSQLVDF